MKEAIDPNRHLLTSNGTSRVVMFHHHICPTWQGFIQFRAYYLISKSSLENWKSPPFLLPKLVWHHGKYPSIWIYPNLPPPPRIRMAVTQESAIWHCRSLTKRHFILVRIASWVTRNIPQQPWSTATFTTQTFQPSSTYLVVFHRPIWKNVLVKF